MPRLLLSLALLLLASSLSAGEMPVSSPRVAPLDTTTWWEQVPFVAAGDGFLVVWESRLWQGYPGPLRLRAYDGASPRQPIATLVAGGRSPHAVWTGSEYLVVRAPQTAGRYGTLLPTGVLSFARVDRDGNVIEGSQTELALGQKAGNVFALAWDGVSALAAVQYAGGLGNALVRLDRNGALLDETPVDYEPAGIAARPGGGFFVLRREDGDAVAAGGDRFAVVDNTTDGLVVKILDSAGAELSRFPIGSTAHDARSIAWDGDEWLTAYREGELLCTARFTGATDVRSNCMREPLADDPFIAAGPAGTFLARKRGGQIVTEAGIASTVMSTAFDPTAAVDERGLLVAWTEPADGGHHIWIGGINDDRSRRPEKPLGGASAQRAPRLIRSGAQTLLAWRESNRVFATRIDAVGAAIPPRIDLGGSGSSLSIAAAARDGGWLVAWDTANEIVAAHLSANLDAQPPEHFGSSTAEQTAPAAATTRDGFLVAWRESESGHVRIVTEPLDANGRRVSGGIRVVEDEGAVHRIGVGCGAETCLVAWSDFVDKVRGVLVRHDGTRIGETRVLLHAGSGQPVIVHAQDDGSFRVNHGLFLVHVSPGGEPVHVQAWNTESVVVGDAVVWRDRPTFVYMKALQIFAFDLPPRLRSVRH